jgi:hypothetical protein
MGFGAVSVVVGFIGFIVSLLMNIFVFDDFDAYGEVPIPGRAALHLPEGEVNIAFHTVAVGDGSGFLPVPDLQMRLQGPDGGADPVVVEDIGATTSVNNDMRRRVWVAQIPAEGLYEVQTDGQVTGFVNPTLAFGHGSAHWWTLVLFGGIFVVGMTDIVVGSMWRKRVKRSEVSPGHAPPGTGSPYELSTENLRVEQLRNLAALRDSGALTQEEYDAERRRILDEL